MKLIYDYGIIIEAFKNNLVDCYSVCHDSKYDIFYITGLGIDYELYEVSNYLFNLNEVRGDDDFPKLKGETLADCINYLNKLAQEYLEDQEQLELEKGL